ncbi:hypothetical protein [Devosia sp.]|uniref:hypothetical protein n=1 Tax=Devosia sp. TaxID=1871048 RepID=UPI002EE39DE1
MTAPADVDVVIAPTAPDTASYVDWPAIVAGIVLASGISLVLLTFGAAIGLSMTDFRAGENAAPIWIAIAAALWLLWVQVSSFMAGGYLTGRLRRRHAGATEDEVDARDGAHGLLVWAGGLVVGGLLAVGGLGAAASAVGSAAATLTNAAATVAGEAADSAADPTAYFTDMLFRPAPAGAAPTTPTAAAAPAEDTTALRAEAGRIFAAGAVSGEIGADDRAYLAQTVARHTGLSDEQAQSRVEQVIGAIDTAKAEAAAAAETARKTGVLAAFLTAASLLVSAAGAFWAAQKGGQHRDQGVVFGNAFRRF